jgi:hypothetical protein
MTATACARWRAGAGRRGSAAAATVGAARRAARRVARRRRGARRDRRAAAAPRRGGVPIVPLARQGRAGAVVGRAAPARHGRELDSAPGTRPGRIRARRALAAA